jgi:hypothetical protein
VDVDRHRPDALGAVEQDRDVGTERGQAVRSDRARDPADVRAGHEARARPRRVGEPGERGGPDLDAAAGAQAGQRTQQPRMLVGRGEDLVAGAELEAGQHADDALARTRGQREVGRVGAQHAGVDPALALAQRARGVHVGGVPALAGGLLEQGVGGPDGGARQRPARPRVEVRGLGQDRELGAQRGGVHTGQAVTGVRSAVPVVHRDRAWEP